MAKQFGQTAADYEETRGADDEVWIRNFKDPSTRIRIIPMEGTNRHGAPVTGTAAWPTEREHYEETAGSFPCDESPTCPGCTDPSERVQKRSRKYYFHALDEKGNVRVFKMGAKLYRVMQGREQRIGTLSDRDYIINKMGQGLDTTYDPEPGEVYPMDFEGLDLPNIADVLTRKYQAAVALYNGEDPGAEAEKQDPTPKEERIAPTRIAPAAKAEEEPQEALDKAWSETGSQASHTETPPATLPDWGPNPTEEQINSAETSEIKLWLDSVGAEYPNRAPRARILAIAKAKAAEPPY